MESQGWLIRSSLQPSTMPSDTKSVCGTSAILVQVSSFFETQGQTFRVWKIFRLNMRLMENFTRRWFVTLASRCLENRF